MIYQSAVDRRYAEHGIIRLSAPVADRAAPSLSQIAALVIRFGMGFAEVARVEPSPVSRNDATEDAMRGERVVIQALV